MASIDELILRNTNPFDNIYPTNFWHKQDNSESTIDYIHQEAFVIIETLLNQVSQDSRTRTVLIHGNTGSGKTYLLSRLKRQLNYKACCVHIPPFPQRDSIWRRILRYTVDSLVQVVENNQSSVLLLWLSTIKQDVSKDTRLDFWRSDKQKFINKLKEIYKQVNIYDPDVFFGVLYELNNLEVDNLAGKYLRGDNLSEESLQKIGVEKSINTETTARENLANFSKIMADIQPIIICFDQIESIARLPNGSIDLDILFQVNAKIREENQNCLIIISISTHSWEQNKYQIEQSYKDTINQTIELRNISLAQAELLLGSRLHSLHQQADTQPISPIYPLNRQLLETTFTTGRTNLRDVLIYARNVYKAYKEWLAKDDKSDHFSLSKKNQNKKDEYLEFLSYFKVKWREEFSQIQKQITQVSQLSSPELIQFLQEVLLALQIEKVTNPLFIRTKYASYSLSYELQDKSEIVGVVWAEDPNITSFFHVMEACRKTLEKNPSLKLSLIRGESLGNPKSQAYKLYKEIFIGSHHRYITTDLNSVHYLATYHNFVRNAREGDLVIGSKIISLKNLQSLIYTTKILHNCLLLQELGVVKKAHDLATQTNGNNEPTMFKPMNEKNVWKESKDYIFNLIITQHCLSRKVLLKKACNNFPGLKKLQLDGLIQQLCWENKIKVIDSKASPESQLICLFPKK
ncbi:ATP-binding protein [Anabaena sp. PCC 7108]|uniref:ATP-binding protein n=1 Tax=Anabaena sp. PCC 7108 TaxID=163908 RepID=UPI00035DB212|nr:ATP-binding protein [Anabaena sp. PCC 7108]